jgi:hypothetical protein
LVCSKHSTEEKRSQISARKNFQDLHLACCGIMFYQGHIKTGERYYEIPDGSQQLERF